MESQYLRDGRSPIPDNELTSKIMSSIKYKNTKPEILLRKALWNSNVRGYRLHWNRVPGRPDIAFPGRKLAIFVNGCFWHRCPICKPILPKTHTAFWHEKFSKNIDRDRSKIESLAKLGWTTLTIWECQIKNDLESCIVTIRNQMDKK